MPPSRNHETRELIRSLRSKRRRSKLTRVALFGVGALVLVAVIVVGVVLATGGTGAKAPGSALASNAGNAGASGALATLPTASIAAGDTATTTKAHTSTTKSPTSTTESSTTESAPTTTSEPATTSTTNWLAGKVVVIDPGHQAHSDSALEPIGPGASQKKAKVSSGTASPTTGTPESAVALAVGLKLRDALEAKGITVVMTRTTQNVDISNSQRAKLANQAHADLAIRLHCDGSTQSSAHGLFTLYPASIKGWTDDIAVVSKQAASIIQAAVIDTTGAQDRGLQERSDLTGFNWSDVPDVLMEMGFMTNAAEDKQLESGTYQDKIVQGLVNGIVEFLRTTS
jgi:N-acetylmuramoyl-L-alanine amidase